MTQARGPVARGARPRSPRQGVGEVRIIAGQWKRTKLPVIDRPGLRPTPDRVRETIFNWLGSNLQGWQVLDAFAGTGALGLEAASRGASRVVLLESDALALKSLNAVLQRLGSPSAVEVHRADALAWMSSCEAEFDLVLLDPPFQSGQHGEALVRARQVLRPGGLVVLESPQSALELAGTDLVPMKTLSAGAVHVQLLQVRMARSPG